MSDRELLELAALAAGLQVKGWVNDQLHYFDPVTGHNGSGWNPLIDDGDALRLAIDAKIDLYIADNDGPAAYAGYFNGRGGQTYCVERFADRETSYAATCRAITRAAADIGRQMRERG